MAQGGWFTDGRCLEVGCQEDGHEAEESSQTGGIPAIALAVLVEDVDLGRLEVEAGVDLNHRAGPGEDRQVSSEGLEFSLPRWDPGTEVQTQMGVESVRPP